MQEVEFSTTINWLDGDLEVCVVAEFHQSTPQRPDGDGGRAEQVIIVSVTDEYDNHYEDYFADYEREIIKAEVIEHI